MTMVWQVFLLHTWQDVSPDRLFIYIHDLQRDTLFVCRPSQTLCELQGVRLAVLELQKKHVGEDFFVWGGEEHKGNGH